MIVKFEDVHPEERKHIKILQVLGLSSTSYYLPPYLMSNKKRCSGKEVIHTLRSCQLHTLTCVVWSSGPPFWRSNGTAWRSGPHKLKRIIVGFTRVPSQSLDQCFVIPDLILQVPYGSHVAWRLVLVLHQVWNPFRNCDVWVGRRYANLLIQNPDA